MKNRINYSLVSVLIFASSLLFAEDAVNLLTVKFDKFAGELPEGISLKEKQDGFLRAELVEMPLKDKNVNVTRVILDQGKYVQMRGGHIKNLQMDKNYLLSFDFKIENLKSPDKEGIRFYVYNLSGGQHVAIQVYGNGSTDGWLTAILPFSGKALAVDSKGAYVCFLAVFNSVTGMIYFSDAILVELPENIKMASGFLKQDGTSAGGTALLLKQ